MRWLIRMLAVLTGAVAVMSILLILILAGSVGLAWFDVEHGAYPWAMLFGGLGAGLALPLFALIAAGMLVLVTAAIVRRERPGALRGSALLLGAVALHAAWLFGIRPPRARPVVLEGRFTYGHSGFSPEFLALCQDPAHPLPRGADLARGAIDRDMPLLVAVHLPEAGWHGSHPDRWPSTQSDSHGTQYWLVRLRGTLKGPAQYGRPALMPYRLDVDSVLHVAPIRRYQDECGVSEPTGD